MGRKAFRNSLLKHSVFGLDTNCFVYQFEEHPIYSPLTRELFLTLKKRKGITSSITFSELIAKEEIFIDKKKRVHYKTALQTAPNTEVVDVDLKIAEYSAGFKVIYNFRLPDALHLATALVSGADVFITNDERFKKVKEMAVIILEDYVKK